MVTVSEGVRVRVNLEGSQKQLALELRTAGFGETQVVSLPTGFAGGTIGLTSVSSGLAYLYGQFTVGRSSAQCRVRVPQSYFQFVFHRLHTPGRIMWDGIPEAVRFGYRNALVLGPNSCPTRVFAPYEQVDEISLLVESSFIESVVERLDCPIAEPLASALAHPGRAPFISSGITTSEMRHSIDALTSCELSDSFKRLYQEARIQEILALRLAQFAAPPCADRDVFLLQRDLDLLERAREILLERGPRPPTIAELSRAVGLNQTKLKAGFKEVYGTTVFSFVRLKRMQHALQLLSEGQCNVGEAAAAIGYKSIAAFTRAFQAELGCSPNSVRGRAIGPTG